MTEHGAFCSHRCAARFRDFSSKKVSDEGQGQGPSLLRTIFMLLLLGAIGLAVAWWKGWLPGGVESLISNLLNWFM